MFSLLTIIVCACGVGAMRWVGAMADAVVRWCNAMQSKMPFFCIVHEKETSQTSQPTCLLNKLFSFDDFPIFFFSLSLKSTLRLRAVVVFIMEPPFD